MKRITFVFVGFIAVLILCLFTKPDSISKVKTQENNVFFNNTHF